MKHLIGILTLGFLIVCEVYAQTSYFSDNLESGTLSNWSNTTDWAASTSNPINGSYSLKHNLSGTGGSSYAYASYSGLTLSSGETVWRFNLKNGAWDPSSQNKFWVFLTANETNLLSSTVDGYAVGVNLTGSTDYLTLWRVDNGAAGTAVVTSSLDWNSSQLTGIEVRRSASGAWTLKYDADGDFDNLTTAGSATETTYTFSGNTGPSFTFTSTRAGDLYLDDYDVYQYTADNPASFSASTASISQINLSWTKNASGDNVMIAVNSSNQFGTPSSGSAYSVGNTLSGGGTIIYNGSATSYNHTGLNGDQTYYYKAWSVDGSNSYSSGIATSSATSGASASVYKLTGLSSLWSEDFTTGSYSVTLGAEGNASSSSYFQKTDGSSPAINMSYTGNTGTYFACQDIDAAWTGSATPSQLSWSSISISSYSYFVISGYFASAATDKIDAADYLKVEYQIDGGSWIPVLEFENDGSTYNTYFMQDTDFDGTGDGTQLSSTFQRFYKTFSASGTNMNIRITVSVGSSGEDIAFDQLELKGSTSTSWNTGSLWSSSAEPSSTKDVIIPEEYEISISSAASCNNLVINENAKLTIAGGSSPGSLSIASGASIINNGELVISSDASGDGILIDDGSITNNGSITVERYLSTSAYHFLSSPVSSGTATMAGSVTDLYAWSEASKSWSTKSGTLTNGEGYAYFANATATRNWTGTPNTGTINIAVSNTDGNTSLSRDNNEGWQLIGNPYPSPISISSFISTNSSLIDGSVYLFDYYNNTSYGSGYNTQDYLVTNGSGSVSSRNSSNVSVSEIGSGQGFFVRTKYGASGNIQFTNSMRSTTATPFYKHAAPFGRFKVGLHDQDQHVSRSLIAFPEEATNAFDPLYDAFKLESDNPLSLYSFIEDNKEEPFVIQGLKTPDAEYILPLGLTVKNNGLFILKIDTMENLQRNLKIYLEDKSNASFTCLSDQENYSVPLNTGTYNNRFFLHLMANNNSTIAHTKPAAHIYTYDQKLYVSNVLESSEIQVLNPLGQSVYSGICKHTNQRIDFSNLPSGCYLVLITHEGTQFSQKVIF